MKKIVPLLAMLIMLLPFVLAAWSPAFAQDQAPSSANPVQDASPAVDNSSDAATENATTTEERPHARLWKLWFGDTTRKYTLEDYRADRVPVAELRTRPMAYLRWWSNRALPIVPTFLYIFLLTIAAQEVLPDRIAASRDCCRKQFWRSLGRGFLVFTLFVCFAVPLFRSEIGTPLAFLAIAILELLLLFGITIATSLFGENILTAMKLADKMAKKPRLSRIMISLAGTIVLSIILAIPGLGILPRFGTRLGTLLATLGMGAFIKTRLGTRPLP